MWAAIKYFNPRNISGCDHVAILKNLLLYRIQRISWKTFEREYGNPFFGLNPYDKITTIYIRKVIRKCTDRVDNIVGVPAFFNPSPPYLLLPLLLVETGQDEVFANYEGAFDQHAVGSEESELFVFGHLWKLILEVHLLVEHAAGVEELLERQSAFSVPFL